MAMQATDHAWGKDSERRPLKSLHRLAFPFFPLLLLLRPLTSFSMSSILLLRTAVRRTDKDRRPRAITAPNRAAYARDDRSLPLEAYTLCQSRTTRKPGKKPTSDPGRSMACWSPTSREYSPVLIAPCCWAIWVRR